MSAVQHLEFRFDWEPSDLSVTAAELRATWARLEVWVRDECVTLLEDVDTQSSRRSIYVPLYPLAEWVVFNWWLLIADGRPNWQRPVGPSQSFESHSLRAVGDGFAWPDLAFFPERDKTLVAWRPCSRGPAPYRVRFIAGGSARLQTADLERALALFVDVVIGRLRESHVGPTPLEQEWDALRNLDADEAEFCRAAAQLGLDPFSEGVDLAQSLEEVFADLEPGLREEFLDSVRPDRIRGGLRWIRAGTEANGSQTTAADGFDIGSLRSSLRRGHSDLASSSEAPWVRGYGDARRIRESLGVTPTAPLTSDPGIPVIQLPVDDRGLVGLTLAETTGVTRLVLGRPMCETKKRFAVARALWSSLTLDGERSLLSSSHSPEQQTARAFAAELLAPATGIQAHLGGATIDTSDEAILDVAEHFGVAELLIRHQLENQILAN